VIACSLSPDPEGVIAMDFNSPQEVEDFIAKKELQITRWVLYGVLENQLEILYEYKDGAVLRDRWDEYLKEYRERHHASFDDVR
jgi:hypothetical protein